MTTLHQLVSDIKKEQKIPTDDLLMILTTAVTDGVDECDTTKKLYKKAYGDTLSEDMCKRWMDEMYGDSPVWTVSQTTTVGEEMGVSWSKITKYEFWAFMNAFYDDFYDQAKRYNHESDPEYFASIVWAYFNDEDAHDKTPASYYFNYVA